MKTRKPLSILLTLCLIVGLLPWSVLPARAGGYVAQIGDDKYDSFEDAVAAWGTGETLKLLADVTTSSPVMVISNGTAESSVTLDLNGHGIVLTNPAKIFVYENAALTLTDSNAESPTHKYTVDSTYGLATVNDSAAGEGVKTFTGGYLTGGYGGGVYVGGGTFHMSGGTIIGNKGTGGGVCVESGGTFELSGGTITGNQATHVGGGGVYVDGGAVFNMTGGTITGNAANGGSTNVDGGGVYVGGTFNMSGGTITDNTVEYGYGCGVYVDVDGTFNVSGGATVSGNKSGRVTQNVYLPSGKTLAVTGALTDGAAISVTLADGDAGSVVAQGSGYALTAADCGHLFSDAAAYGVMLKEGAAKLVTATEVSDDLSTLYEALWEAQEHENTHYLMYVRLTDEFTINAPLNVPANVTLTLDLNDHYLLLYNNRHDNVISVAGSLTLTDGAASKTKRWLELYQGRCQSVSTSEPETTGLDDSGSSNVAVTGGFLAGGAGGNGSSGGGVYVNGGSFSMAGGTIAGNAALNNDMITGNGGGVYVSGGAFHMSGGTISGNSAGYGGVFVSGGAEFTMTGGSITGNTANDSGGVCVNSGAVFHMSGGTISGNTASGRGGTCGGGVRVDGSFMMTGGSITGNTADDSGGVRVDGSFTMTGGYISGNTANDSGGGVRVYGTFNMNGGTITGNTAGVSYGGGVWVDPRGTFKVSGSATVKDNFKGGTLDGESGVYVKGDSGTADNVYLVKSDYYNTLAKIAVAGALTGTIGVTLASGYGAGAFAQGGSGYDLTAADCARFASDNANYVAVLNGDGAAELVNVTEIKGEAGWSALQAALTAGGCVRLAKDVTASDSDTALTVGDGKTVTLDLNGHIIDRGLASASAADDGSVITVEGTLTLTDSSDNASTPAYDGTGKITGGNTTGNGGGVYVGNGGAFTMTGGMITGNAASGLGGGVYVDNGGAFTMTGGTITGNTAAGNGGGVFVDDGGAFYVSGTPVIRGNKKGEDANNVAFESSDSVQATDALTDGAEIWVHAGEGAVVALLDYANTPASARCFRSDMDGSLAGALYFNSGHSEARLSSALQVAISAGGKVTLTESVTVNVPLTVPAGVPVTLDLAGFTIDRGLAGKSAVENGSVITVEGNLTLTDSSDNASTPAYDGTGKITGGNTTGSGGGVYVKGGEFTMNGGTISGNKASNTVDNTKGIGGGVYVEDGKFTMNGGTITENTAGAGGGVYVESGTFTMNGGTISGNNAGGSGGGVWLSGTFTMTGGSITGNAAVYYGGGVFIKGFSDAEVKGRFCVSGTPVISGNTKKGGAASNVQVSAVEPCNPLTVIGALGIGASIGVTTVKADPDATAPESLLALAAGVFAQADSGYNDGKLTADDAACFHSDSDAYALGLNNGKAYLGFDISKASVAFKTDTAYVYDGTGKEPEVTVTLGGKTLEKDTDYTVSYSDNVNAGTDAATVTVTGIGDYAGTASAKFSINPKAVTGEMISAIAAQTYDGNVKEPVVVVKDGTTPLSQETDYTVEYSGNIDPGKATVTVTGKGNYSGTVTKTFQIYGVKGAWSESKLTATAHVEDHTNALLIAAVYDENGKQVNVEVVGMNAGQVSYETGISKTSGYTYKLMLVSKTSFAPLCAAWDSTTSPG